MDGTGSATANMTTKTGHQGAHEPSPVGMILVYVPIMALVGCASIAFLYRIWSDFINNQRLKFAIRHDCKISFHRPNRPKAWLNRHLLYAPLFERRHNREFRICRGHINMGNIPTRLETLLIICYIALNVLICVAVVDWSQSISQSLRCLIGTTGTLAIVNLVPLVITAGRNNPLILVLRVPFDAFNLVHRWLGRIVVAEAVAHTMAVLVRVGMSRGWDTIPDHLFHNPIFTYGFVSIHYKTYYKPGSQVWQRLLRLAIVAWRNCGKSLTSATIQLLPGDVARVDVTVIRPWKFEAGQYMYLYIPSLGLWTSHPFSAAWESADKPHGSFSAMDSERSSNSSSRSILSDTARDTQRTVSFLIRKRDGFTKKMLKSVGLKVGLQRRVLVLAEGPFGAIHSFGSYGSTVLIAGGIGITHSISYLRELVDEFAKGSVATRRITLLWVVRSIDHLQWVQPWMTSILNHPVVQGSVAFSNASTTLDSRSPYSIYNDTCFERTLSLSVNVHLTTYYSSSNTDTFNIDPLPARYSSLICNQEKRSNPYNDEITPVTPAHTKTFPKDSPSFSRPYPYPHPHLTELSSPTGSSSSSTLNKTIDQDYYQHDDEKTHILTPSLSNVATKITTTTNTNTNTSTRNQLFQDWTQLSTPTAPVTINLGKPFFRQVLEREMAQQIGAMAVSVCGPGGMGDEVRKAVREVQGKKTVEFFEESFSW
uniref:ferric-chelate reductase (NADPH) n=1 Tax=Talaromyces marneffei PM1 TaxID=1077442 RepID=A0A093VKD7_TALMA